VKVSNFMYGVSGLALILSGVVAAQPAAAQTDPSATAPATSAAPDKKVADKKDAGPEVVSAVVVTARRKALETAIEIKMNSDTIVDSVVADEAGKLPDNSITEVLQRVSGVTLSRFSADQGNPSFQIEGTGISVRGLPYNSSTLNGRQVFSASGASAIQWQEVTPELGAGVDVYKAARADLIEGGTSSIDLRSRLPFDYKKPTIDMSAGFSYGDQIKKGSPNISGLATQRFDTPYGEVGVLVDLAYSKYFEQQSNARISNYLLENDPNVASGQALVPTGYNWSQDTHGRDRYGVYTALQWKPNPNFTATSTLFYSQYHTNDHSFGGSWGNNPSNTVENIPQNATFDANGAMTKGSLYVGASGVNTPIFGWGGNNFLYQYLPRGDPSYSWIWQYGWSPDYGHDATNTLLTADCRTPYGAITSSTPTVNWGKWASPGMFFCQPAQNSSGSIGLNLGATTSVGRSDSSTLDFSNSFVWTPNTQTRVRGAFQYVRSLAKSQSMYAGITQGDPNLSSASFDVTHDIPRLGGFNAVALANTDTAYFNSFSYNGNDNKGSMAAANIDVDYRFEGDHFFKSVSFGARVARREERDNFIGTYWAPITEDWVSYSYPHAGGALPATGAGYRAYLTGQFANGTVLPSDYQLYNFNNFFGGKSPSPGKVLLPSLSLMQSFNWQHLAAMSAPVNTGTNPETIQQYWHNHIDSGLGIVNTNALNEAAYFEAKFGRDASGFWPAFSGNIGFRVVRDHLRGTGNLQVNSSGAFYLTQACAYQALGPGGGGGAPSIIPGCDQYTNITATDGSAISTPETRTYSYTRVLPSFNLKADLPEHLVLRFAASEGMTMPNLSDLKAGGSIRPVLTAISPGSSVNYAVMTSQTGADKKPVMIKSGDVSLEWYPKNGVYTYLDLFRKELRDQDLYTYFYQNHPTQLFDKTTNQAVTVVTPWFYQTNISAHKAAEIKGFELGGRSFFDMLPTPFDGFGVSGSVTYVDSKNPAILANSVQGPYIPDNNGLTNNNGPIPGNPNTDFKTLPYFGMAKWSSNVELYYSKGWFTARLAYNWHDKQLISTQQNPLAYVNSGGNPYSCGVCVTPANPTGKIYQMVPLWADAAGYLDFSMEFRLNDKLAFGGSIGNLTNTVTKTLQEPLPGKFERYDTFVADRRISVWLRSRF
jgi:iron complex outermembrane receptor protein